MFPWLRRRGPPCTSAPAAAVAGLVSLAIASGLPAQEARPLIEPPAYTIDRWTTQDGLPQNSVNAIVQDPDGYLWLGTFGGLVRFDGTSFTVIERTDATGGRHLDRVLSLAVEPDGDLWIGTEDAGLLRLSDGAYEVYTRADGLPGETITALHLAQNGELWIGTASGGVARFADGRFRTFAEVDGIPIEYVASFAESSDGRVWINDQDRLVVAEHDTLSVVRREWEPAAGVDRVVTLEDRAGALWVGVPDSLLRVADGTLRYFHVPDQPVMVEEPGSGYWIGTTNDGLYFLRPDADGPAVRRYALPDGRLSFRVRSVLLDVAGNVWAGTDANGLIRVKRNLFTTYARQHGLSHDVATAIYGSRDGNVWVATNCGGVNEIDPVAGSVTVRNPRSPGDPEGDPCVFALTQTTDGTMWQGSWGRGVSSLPTTPGEASRRVAALPDSVALALFTDRDGTMWVGTQSGGLSAVEDGRVVATYTTADGLSDDNVRLIRQTRDGALWIGTLEGLNRLENGAVTDTVAEGLHVRAVHEDADGNLWIGTYGAGLILLRDGVATAITHEDGLADDVVSSILDGGDGSLWMSGNRGIHRTRRSDLIAFAEGRTERVHSVLYGVADGLRNAETNGGFQPSAWRDSRGRLWFPTLEGVAVVDPDEVAATDRVPAVSIEEVIVDGAPVAPLDSIVVGPGRPNLEVRYAGLSLSSPEHLTFRYRLEGLEEDWVLAAGRRAAYYPRLQPGEYRFVVGAANRNGVWRDSGAGVRIRVESPFYETWPFRLLLAAAALALFGIVIRRRELAARRAQAVREAFSRQLIESQERERKKVAAALHDGLGQQLLVAKNRVLLALGSNGVDPAARSQLEQVDGVLDESLTDVRALAHRLTPHQLEHLGLTAALEAMIDSVADSAEISIEARIDPIDGLLSEEGEIGLYRVVQEALSNLARHSGADRGVVRIRREGAAIRLTVADDGVGFPAGRDGEARAEAEGGFGLSGMAERVRILGGHLRVTGAPGHGTRVSATVPLSAEKEGT